MPRTTAKPVLALLAGVALISAAAQAEAGSISTPASSEPVVLDAAALDSVTAGNYQVGAFVQGAAAGLGGGVGSADVLYRVEGQGNAWGGSALGLVTALGFGLGQGADANSATDSNAAGNITYTHDFRKALTGPGFAFELSASIGFGASIGQLVNPLAALQPPPT